MIATSEITAARSHPCGTQLMAGRLFFGRRFRPLLILSIEASLAVPKSMKPFLSSSANATRHVSDFSHSQISSRRHCPLQIALMTADPLQDCSLLPHLAFERSTRIFHQELTNFNLGE
jgi:hypothetical protein